MASPALKRKFDIEEDPETLSAPNPKRPAVETAQTMDVEAGIISHQQYLLIPQRTRFNSTSSWSTDSSHSPTPSLSSLPSSPAGIIGHESAFYSSTGSVPFPATPADSSMMDLDMPHSAINNASSQPLHSDDAPAIALSASALFLPMPTQQKAGLTHLRDDCTQIPKLRVSNHAGLKGERTLWSVCEQCGATEMFRGCGGTSVGWGYD